MGFINELWSLFREMGLYLLLGFLVGALLRAFLPKGWIFKALGKSSLKSISAASFFGVPLPLCSCSVVPTAISLRREGASKESVVSFLTSTPQTGADSILVSAAFLGWPLSIAKVIVAFVTGISGGLLTRFFGKNVGEQSTSERSAVEDSSSKLMEHAKREQKQSPKNPIEILRYAFVELLNPIKKWIVLGVLMAAALNYFLPPSYLDFLSQSEGGRWLSYLGILAFAIPLYICSTGGVPMAASLIHAGFSPGSAFLFLMAGPATNSASIVLLWKEIGPRATIVFVANIFFGALLTGYLFDVIFPSYSVRALSEHGSHLPGWILDSSALTLLLMIGGLYLRDFLFRKKSLKKEAVKHSYSIQVDGMHCENCVSTLRRNLADLPQEFELDIGPEGKGQLKSTEELDEGEVKKRVDNSGFTFVSFLKK